MESRESAVTSTNYNVVLVECTGQVATSSADEVPDVFIEDIRGFNKAPTKPRHLIDDAHHRWLSNCGALHGHLATSIKHMGCSKI
jgi:hypothetical protein